MINIIHLYLYFMSILKYVYIILDLKNLNILQIHLYNINKYFGLGSNRFWVRFDYIHTLLIINRIQKIPPHSGQTESVSIIFRLNCHLCLYALLCFAYQLPRDKAGRL
jgi:hypothetical protein